MQRTLFIKLALVALVTALLQVPVGLVRGLIAERQAARGSVSADVARGTSEAQRVVGPVLAIPWTRRTVENVSEFDDAGRRQIVARERKESGVAAFLPATLAIKGQVDLQPKHRGIYTANVYRLDATLDGSFALPAGLGVPERGKLEWGHPSLVIGIQDTRGIRDGLRIQWNGTPLDVLPGGMEAAGIPAGVQARVVDLDPAKGGSFRFSVNLPLAGTERLELVPSGATTTVELTSPWPHPSFIGRVLPEPGTRISAEGFSAQWKTTYLATNLGQVFQRCVDGKQCDAFRQHTIGVAFVDPVDPYLMAERSVKYGILFILVTFSAFFLMEVLRGLAIHPMQYALVGAALAIFFLLLVSLSEHLHFALSFFLATAACVLLNAYYVSHVLRSRSRGAWFGAGLASLYGLLFVLLRSEDHALLMGSLLVFGLLAAAMVTTRKVDWYAFGTNASPSGTRA